MIEDTMLFKKVFGCLAIGAIGDNLGRPVEGWHYKDIEAKYGRLEDPWAGLKGGDQKFDVGTDDTALGQILCHCYIDKGRPISVEDYGEYWLKEMDPLKFFHCLRNTYELLKMGYSARVTGTFNIVTGSGLMAINPVGIFNAGDPERAYVDGLDMASLVQRDLDMFIPGVIAAAIAEAFRPGATCDSVIEAAIRVAPSKPIVTFDKRDPDNLRDTLIKAVKVASRYPDVFSAREGLYENCLQYAPIDPQEVFALAFGIFKASRGNTRMAVIGGANTGRDADTLASLNGQLCGALNGIDSAPKEWLEGLKRSRGYDRFYETAVKMTKLVAARIEATRRRVEELEQLMAK
ncbi:MAG: ADP-ribosylglycohydrolase family protein [bacterium]